MTGTNQKLREALQLIAWSNDSKWQADCARQALALPTADHLPDAGKMLNGLTQAETDASASVSGLTAAPVGEREAFERTMMDKFGWERKDFKLDDFGYFDGHAATAWMAWQARAALIAGDAVDAQRTPLTDDQMWSLWNSQGIDEMTQREAIAFARNVERAHGIDAAMRKDKT
jgi:hypothetical protein